MLKFGRNYVLNVETQTLGSFITIKLPFTLEFDIFRNTLSSSNIASFRVYNLSQDVRNRILQDQWITPVRKVTFNAGYGAIENYPTLFTGTITRAWSVREGTNFITQVECFDAGFAYTSANFNGNFKAGTTKRVILEAMIESLRQYGVSFGAIENQDANNYLETIPRGNAYAGATINLLQDLSGGCFFIDNNKAYILGKRDIIPQAQAYVINSASGLLQTPVRETTKLIFTTLFEPGLIVGQQVKLDSQTGQNFNTFYKVTGLHHRGMISAAVCGDATTEVEVLAGPGTNRI